MIKKGFAVLAFFLLLAGPLSSQENRFFLQLAEKELATFNDAITLMKLVFDERDDNNVFIDNVLWAASKKLFRVTIPIKEDEINPIITRREFSYWLCKLFELNGLKTPTRRSAYKICVELGIIAPGRGPFDSFTGQELLESFSFFDNYVRISHIRARGEIAELKLYDDNYDSLPGWRRELYRELEEQRAEEQRLKEEKRLKRKQKRQDRLNKSEDDEVNLEDDSDDDLDEKIVE